MKQILALTETLAAVFLLLIALLTAANVLARELFAATIPDWFDGSRLLLAIAMFWGIALATHRGSHICVDILWEHLGATARRRLEIAVTALCVAFFAPLAWMVWVKVGSTGTQATSDLRLPLIWFYPVAALGATATALLALHRLAVLWARHLETMKTENPHGS